MAQQHIKKAIMTDEEIQMALKLHQHIRFHDNAKAILLLKKLLPEVKHKLIRRNEEPYIEAAMVIAISASNKEFLEYLVNELKIDIDDPVPALEIAIKQNRSIIIEYLVGLGADVTKVAMNGEVILTACKIGSVKAVQLLVNHGADLSTSGDSGDTCLMKAVKHAALCRFILGKNVDVNCVNKTGKTALHFAAQSNFLDTVKLLLKFGADPFCKDNQGDDPLRSAALNGAVDTMDFLLETVYKDVKRHIESLQLLGTHYFLQYSIYKILTAWGRAISLSSTHHINSAAATLPTPFGTIVEATSLSELEGMDREGVGLQSLVLTHKILGSAHDSFLCQINEITRFYFNSGLYDRWLRNFAFNVRMICNPTEAVDYLTKCFRIGLKRWQLCENIFALKSYDAFSSKTTSFDSLKEFMRTLTEEAVNCSRPEEAEPFLQLILMGIFMFAQIEFENFERFEFEALLRHAIRIGLRCTNGRGLLLASVEADSDSHCFRSFLPDLKVTSMILECGSDVDERDNDGCNAVHLLFKQFLAAERRGENFYRSMAEKLVEHGVHLDSRNSEEVETAHCLRELGIRITPPINLMCLASRGIRRFNIPYLGIIPKFLVEFVDMH